MSNNNVNYAIFNGVNLNTITGFSVLASNPYKVPTRKLSSFNIARTDKNKVSSAFYVERLVTLRVGIACGTRALTEASIDSLMALLQGLEKELQLPQGAGLRKYFCTLADVNELIAGGAYWEAELVFQCSDNFGYDIADSLLAQVSGFNSGQKTTTLAVGGSAPSQLPVTTLTLTAVAGATSQLIYLGNSATGQELSISRTWIAGDVLVVDSYNRTVQVNGIDVDFNGAFPEFAPGTAYATYRDTFTSRTMSFTMVYKRRWV